MSPTKHAFLQVNPSLRATNRHLSCGTPGLSTGQIASRLYLAPKTIRNRVSELIGKLGTPNRDEAITLARAAGLGTRPPSR